MNRGITRASNPGPPEEKKKNESESPTVVPGRWPKRVTRIVARVSFFHQITLDEDAVILFTAVCAPDHFFE